MRKAECKEPAYSIQSSLNQNSPTRPDQPPSSSLKFWMLGAWACVAEGGGPFVK